MNKPESLNEKEAKSDLEELQKKYGALIVNFNNQQAELAKSLKNSQDLEQQVARLTEQVNLGRPMTSEENQADVQNQMNKYVAEIRTLEAQNMALQKKVNQLHVEHVSEEEVDQLFYALEQKEAQLKQVEKEKGQLEAEVLTARQLTARGINSEPKYVEVHHNALSDDDSDEEDDAKKES